MSDQEARSAAQRRGSAAAPVGGGRSSVGSTPDPAATCAHEWEYDVEESKGPWTGYIERCKLCGALQQVPQ